MSDTTDNWSFTRPFTQIAALPRRLQLWLAWLMVSTLFVPLTLLDNAFFAAMMICQVANLVFGGALMKRHGMVRLLALSHLLFWTPMLAKFACFYESLDDPLLLACAWIVVATIAMSLVLDARDFRDWMRGERQPVGQ